MQLYPIENFSTNTYKRLYYLPISDFKPDFYKNQLIENSISFLSRDDVNKTLATKKMEPLSWFTKDYSVRHFKNIFALFTVAAITFIFFGVFGTYELKDQHNRQINWCSQKYELYDTVQEKQVDVLLNAPCKPYKFTIENKLIKFTFKDSKAPLILSTTTVLALFLTLFIRLSLFYYEQWRKNCSIRSFNTNLELNCSRLSIVSDVSREIAAKDIACIFPYLEDDQLPLLKFSHLKKAYKYWEKVFKEKLDASLYSKQQLSIWRLFEQFKKANHKTQIKMLKNPILQDVIATEPLFFEILIKNLGFLNNKDERIIKLGSILKNKILIPDFEEKDLISVIMEVSSGKKLRDVIANSECENLMGFDLFFKTGKLKFQKYSECYDYFKLATHLQHHEIADWLESNLKANFEEFLKDLDLSLLLEELDSLNLESFKIKIDQHLKNTWGKIENRYSDDFEQKYLFAKKHNLFLTAKSLKDHFIDCAQKMTIGQPFDGKRVEKNWTHIFDKCEILFGEDKKNIVQIFEDRIAQVLNEDPHRIEDIANAAEENRNHQLIELLKIVYNEDPDKFSKYWLSPFTSDLAEII